MLAARAVTVILRSSVLNPLNVTVARLCCSDSQLKVAPFAHCFFFQKVSHGFICAFGFNLRKTHGISTLMNLRACVRRAPTWAPQVGEQ